MKSILKILIICMLMLGVAIGLDNSTTLAQPPKTKFPGYRSGVQVANLESSEATITIKCFKDDGTQVTGPNDSIPANSSKTYVGTRLPLPVPDDDCSGALIIESNTQIAAIANILDSAANAYASYVGYNSGGKVFIPLVRQ